MASRPQKLVISSDIATNPAECIVPIFTETTAAGEVKIRERVAPENRAAALQRQQEKQALKISISDCIMCSGCISSAEEIFLKEQNGEKLLQLLKETPKPFMIALAESCELSFKKVLLRRIDAPFEDLSRILASRLAHACDGCVAAQGISLISEQPYKQAAVLMNVKAAAQCVCEEHPNRTNIAIVTHCPAVRLFILKRNPELAKYLLPVASPMEIFGEAVGNNVVRISIQPCHDRKIEQCRGAKLDLVLTAQELLSITAIDDEDAPVDTAVVGEHSDRDPDTDWEFTFPSHLFSYLQASGYVASDAHALAWSRAMNANALMASVPLKASPFQKLVIHRYTGYNNLQNVARKLGKYSEDRSTLNIFDLHACPYGCFAGANLANDTHNALATVANVIHDYAVEKDKELCEKRSGSEDADARLLKAVADVKVVETNLRETEEGVLSPEELAKRKGAPSGIRITDLAW